MFINKKTDDVFSENASSVYSKQTICFKQTSGLFFYLLHRLLKSQYSHFFVSTV